VSRFSILVKFSRLRGISDTLLSKLSVRGIYVTFRRRSCHEILKEWCIAVCEPSQFRTVRDSLRGQDSEILKHKGTKDL
jgi:hypothetical protein